MVKIAINGLGRIGRNILKIALEKGVNIVAVNDLTDLKNLVYLIKYDSVYGNYEGKIQSGKDFIKINNKKIKVFSESDPQNLPWGDLGIDIVIESTGRFGDRKDAERHLKAGAKRVVITASGKDPDITVVMGVNNDKIKKTDKIISNASCTTNCLTPIVKILDDAYGIKKGFMTTVHGYTSSQSLIDSPSKKFRRGRAAANNIVPTTSGATNATTQVLPNLKGKIDGLAFRVPILTGSIVDFVAELEKQPTKEQINNLFKKSASGKLKGILDYTEDELVSSDIIGNSHSSIVDGSLTQVIGNTVKILSWYDNEYGYSARVVDLVKYLGK
ncbi:MAG: type I glyceraldehyde-3-phosphate dehydrogenase [Nanoarchaeota archaeon]